MPYKIFEMNSQQMREFRESVYDAWNLVEENEAYVAAISIVTHFI